MLPCCGVEDIVPVALVVLRVRRIALGVAGICAPDSLVRMCSAVVIGLLMGWYRISPCRCGRGCNVVVG